MNETSEVIVVSANGEDIFQIVQRLEHAMGEVPRAHAVIAALSIAVTMQKPDITEEKLQEAVKGASQWICMFLSMEESTGLPKEQLN